GRALWSRPIQAPQSKDGAAFSRALADPLAGSLPHTRWASHRCSRFQSEKRSLPDQLCTRVPHSGQLNVPDAGSGNCSHFASYHVWHYWHLKFWENSISRSHQDQQADYSELASGNGNPV